MTSCLQNSRNKKAVSLFVLVGIVTLVLSLATGCSFNKSEVYLRDPERILWDSTLSIVVLPIDSVIVEYVDNTQVLPDSQFTDSFFIDAANGILQFEAMKRFPKFLTPAEITFGDNSHSFPPVGFSRLAKDTADIDPMAEYSRALAEAANADLILVPYASKVRHVIYQQQAWRGGGPSYERPVAYSATATSHVQVWDKTGKLIFERIGVSDAGRPVMYSLFEREQKEGEDVAKFAKHLYAPPLVRALYMSIRDAMRIRH